MYLPNFLVGRKEEEVSAKSPLGLELAKRFDDLNYFWRGIGARNVAGQCLGQYGKVVVVSPEISVNIAIDLFPCIPPQTGFYGLIVTVLSYNTAIPTLGVRVFQRVEMESGRLPFNIPSLLEVLPKIEKTMVEAATLIAEGWPKPA